MIVTTNLFKHKGPIAHAARQFGFNPDDHLRTIDGDEARVFAIDGGHPFPLVGEIFDAANGRAWLARWNTLGHYMGTPGAISRHSLVRNILARRPKRAERASLSGLGPRHDPLRIKSGAAALMRAVMDREFRRFPAGTGSASVPPGFATEHAALAEAAATRPLATAQPEPTAQAEKRPLTPSELQQRVNRLADDAGLKIDLLVVSKR